MLRWRFAARLDEVFLDELGEVRLTVEPEVARMAALRRTDRDLAELEDALAAMRAAAGDQVEADLAFHHTLTAGGAQRADGTDGHGDRGGAAAA
ncbi:FCD domain-containing protein [Nonomuraea sp. GTA35]|uniref:FCD domain-containing protein n=1 Tax=Nonomuraea sp. GTA35 TaxID=1676746 RepID=UPI0035BEF605